MHAVTMQFKVMLTESRHESYNSADPKVSHSRTARFWIFKVDS